MKHCAYLSLKALPYQEFCNQVSLINSLNKYLWARLCFKCWTYSHEGNKPSLYPNGTDIPMGEEKQWTKKYMIGGINAIKKKMKQSIGLEGVAFCVWSSERPPQIDGDIYWEMGVKGENESSGGLEEQAFQPEETTRSKALWWNCTWRVRGTATRRAGWSERSRKWPETE